MTIRRFLIIAPAIVTLVLLISYFWVPTYEEQTKGNPDRLVQFITASIGDATMLNPTLSAESASSQIENMVFEGLIDRDEELQYRGRVAHSWKIYEHAFFYINDRAVTAQWGRITPDELMSKPWIFFRRRPSTGP
jgi:ABC-type transport system substrate-binding protein